MDDRKWEMVREDTASIVSYPRKKRLSMNDPAPSGGSLGFVGKPVQHVSARCLPRCAAWLASVLIGLACSAPPLRAEMVDLNAFLRGAEEAAQVAVPLRGDGQFEIVSPETTRRDQVALVLRPPADTFIALQQRAIKAVLLGTDAFRLKPGTDKVEPFPLDASLDDSDFTREDLEPFRLAHYKDARISDDSAAQVTVTLYPAESQYSLVVITFDRHKKVPLKTLYYRDTVSNLVKMQRDTDYVLVGEKWKPTTMAMESFKLRTHTTLNVRWAPEDRVPAELFNPAALAQPSLSLWPAATPVP